MEQQRYLNTSSERSIGSPAGTASDRYSALMMIERSSISWRAIFAGTLIGFLAFTMIASLGMALGGRPDLWLIGATLASLFLSSFIAGRVAGMISTRIGGVQGLVIASLYFGFLLTPLGAFSPNMPGSPQQVELLPPWGIFGMLAVGTLCAYLGGRIGAVTHLRDPLSRSDEKNFEIKRAA